VVRESNGYLLPTTTYTLNPQMGHPVGTTTGIQKGKERKEKERERLTLKVTATTVILPE
jgi:hypothetical protein